jgi:hypothetical protein
MLLSLLKPEVRLAYAESDVQFPVTGKKSKFIAAGINLTHSGSTHFGQRTIETSKKDTEILPIYFGDFFNYSIVYDLLSTIEMYRDGANGTVASELGLKVEDNRLDEFSKNLAASRCWFGFLNDVMNYGELRIKLAARIDKYLSFFNFNSDEIPEVMRTSKTTVGEPISTTARLLVQGGIVPENVPVYVQIDQYEALIRVEGTRKEYGSLFREVVNKALSLRDPHVSYRIGTRGYAWDEHPKVYGSDGNLERDRDFKLVDLDAILRRKENRETWIFPGFAEDVFRKRLLYAQYQGVPNDGALEMTVGRGLTPEQRATKYCGTSPERAVKLEQSWPNNWKEELLKLTRIDPLSARLGEAWARQKDKRKKDVVNYPLMNPPVWCEPANKYWRKERIQVALMQIAGRCAERMIWSGKDDIVELSGGNILIFVSICQHIWSAWLRTMRGNERKVEKSVPRFDDRLQAVGIQETSTHWYNKLAEESGGTTRQRFVTLMATELERHLYNDDALSYPGANGFSLELADLDNSPELRSLLNECVDYGALVDSPHTTKLSNRRPRQKWYLSPILSPHFKLPHVRTKEPAYVSVKEVVAWLNASQTSPFAIKQPVAEQTSEQTTLFPEGEE